jgi:hypothetical protein
MTFLARGLALAVAVALPLPLPLGIISNCFNKSTRAKKHPLFAFKQEQKRPLLLSAGGFASTYLLALVK